MSPLTGACGDGACQHGHSNEAQLWTPGTEEIVTMTVAALQESQSKRSGEGDRGRSPGTKQKLWFEAKCFKCRGNKHKKPESPAYKTVLSKNGGGRPKGYKGASEKAREEHRPKHGNTSTRPRSTSRDSKGQQQRQAVAGLENFHDAVGAERIIIRWLRLGATSCGAQDFEDVSLCSANQRHTCGHRA